MPKDALERMMRMILPFRLEIAEITGTWKLNQNKSDEMREAAASHMNMSPVGQETALLSALMLAIHDPE
jgi:transcriptional regulator